MTLDVPLKTAPWDNPAVIRVIPPIVSRPFPDVCIELLTLPQKFAAVVAKAGLRRDPSKTPVATGKGCRSVADVFGDY